MNSVTSGDWRPTASLEVLKLRARLLERTRAFFSARGVLEVETPILSAATTPETHIESFQTTYVGPGFGHGKKLYLQPSPEFAMKRLLAAGSGSIYQLGKVFRNNESGRLHNPEFTMLEWYRLDFDHHQLMREVEALVTGLLDNLAITAVEKLSYAEAFEQHAGLDPLAAREEDFAACAKKYLVRAPETMTPHQLDDWRDLILTHVVEPHLGKDRLTFIYDFPATQASFARIRPGTPPLASRFELYVNGVELANGFHELTDVDEQALRLKHQLLERRHHAANAVPLDERLLAALATGLPDCAGVALGFDRLVMLAASVDSIDEVLAFPIDRA
jgi:lysyl-tRNA synthetase class 2